MALEGGGLLRALSGSPFGLSSGGLGKGPPPSPHPAAFWYVTFYRDGGVICVTATAGLPVGGTELLPVSAGEETEAGEHRSFAFGGGQKLPPEKVPLGRKDSFEP